MRDRILVVDDNPMNTKLVKVLLELRGYEVATAANAVEARASVDGARPALILMDLQLPEVDGYTLTSELLARPDLQGVPIVAVTAYAMRGDEEKALARGCVGYITKPIDTRGFANVVASYLDRYRASPSSAA